MVWAGNIVGNALNGFGGGPVATESTYFGCGLRVARVGRFTRFEFSRSFSPIRFSVKWLSVDGLF